MRRLLLDTHAYVWAISDPSRLGTEASKGVRNPANTVFVSAATVWEMAIKHRAGRWPEADHLLAEHETFTTRLGATPLSVHWTHARRAGALRWEHTDPFDRMLAAQALLEDAELVTRDRAFGDVTGLSVLW